MRLVVDLRFDAPGLGEKEGELHLGFHRVAGALRDPRELRSLLRDCAFDEVTVVEDALPPSAVQALALVAVAAARSSRFQVGRRRMGRLAFLARALARAARAVPAELLRTARLGRLLRSAADHPHQIPTRAGSPASVAYLRIEPSLRWMGEYVGGAATHTTGVINGFVQNGLDVRVLAPERPAGTDGARFTRVPVERVYHLVRGLTYTDYSRAVLRAAGDVRADFVYQRYTLGSVAGLELAERLGVPLVQEFNGSEIWVERHWGSGGLRMERELEAVERRNLLDASLVVVVSDVLKDQVVEHGVPAERVLVNPNGVDVDRLAPFREREPGGPTVGFIGTFGQWHGVQLLPAIADAVRERRPDARWVVIGDGVLRPQVEEEIDRRGLREVIELTGLVDHDRALELLAGCQVCVSPHVPNPDGSRFFGSPTKLFEYMGLAKPIVASDLEQIGEVIDDGRTGLLCPPGDTDAAAVAVGRLLDDPGLRARLGQAALADAATRYSWRAHCERILRALGG